MENGEWCFNQDSLRIKAVEFFENLYGEAPPVLRDIPSSGFPSLNPSEISFLKSAITNEEINVALFDMAPLKAPRSDGFYAHFFQSQWNILGKDVCQWVKDVFDGKQIELDLNNTSIVLIPKKDSPKDFGHFWPISLCSVLYKLIMKVIANRFKGRPLSPYLFVFCMDWLSHLIRTEMEVGNWDPIRLSRAGLEISHLFFANDLVIFCKAQVDQARLLDSILSQFCRISRHKISVRKSSIFFSKDTEVDTRNQISQLFGFQEV
ncbi:hypothetical protein PVK06_034853 [Gossypium arboreum]|uniref:Reverse transcriptase domain-containing protein n=1 Tax=Gossypium arboreum TaxID=29729 RepID=A0ABR0NFA7_GOSAR|nr:hypothetical protein PVK06_034853 [Gossypium arboreum]